MNIAVLTPEREIYSGEITSVQVPGTKGKFEILKGHAPIVSSLVSGAVRIIAADGDRVNFTIERGFVEILNNEVSLLVQGVEQE